MAIIEGRDPALVDNYGANPQLDRPDAPSGSLPSPNTDHEGIEKPARKISMISQPPEAPKAEESTPEQEPEDTTQGGERSETPDETV